MNVRDALLMNEMFRVRVRDALLMNEMFRVRDARSSLWTEARRILQATIVWCAMARLWAGRCRPCGNTGIEYLDTEDLIPAPFPCSFCDGRGWHV